MRSPFSILGYNSVFVALSAMVLLGTTRVANADDASKWSTPALDNSPPGTVRLSSDSFESETHGGRPQVHLDHLVFPKNIQGSPMFEKHLKRTLRREAARVDWGAGGDNRIEYRFEVTQLKFTFSDGALRIRCSAVGALPGGKTAKSDLSYGGQRSERNTLTKKVLDIVARGVIARLAELERRRRGLH